jgi:DNA invertase Pin-like site-specific DNA recombinase
MRLGYKRVSTIEQNTTRQLDGIEIDKVYEDKCSGSTTDRPQLQRLLDNMRSGDTIIVHDISRLARNLTDLLQLIETINSAGVQLQFIKEAITYNRDDKNQKLMLSIMGAVATFERDMIKERQAEGIAIAKANGIYFNRKQSKAINKSGIIQSLKEGLSVRKTANKFSVAPSTVSRIKKAELVLI